MNKLLKYLRRSKQYISDNFVKIPFQQSQYVIATQRKQPTKLKFNKMQYPQLDKFMIRFFNSKPIEGRVSGKSLAFVVGAQNSGKTDFIQKNLKQIKKRKLQIQSQFNTNNKYTSNNKNLQKYQQVPQYYIKSPEYVETQIQQNIFDNEYSLMVKINFKQRSGQFNFINFVQDLHEQLESRLFELLARFQERQSKKSLIFISHNNAKANVSYTTNKLHLLSPQIIKNIVIHENAPQYIFMYIKDVVYAILQDKDSIYLNKQNKQILQKWNDQVLVQTNSQQFFDKHYMQLIGILYSGNKQNFNNGQFKGGVQLQKTHIAYKLFHSVFKRIQYQNRPQQYINSWYQTGIQTTNYIFDILNFISGLGKYVQAIQRKYTSQQISIQQKRQLRQTLQLSNNFILQGNHIDVGLVLMNLEDSMFFKNRNTNFLEFFDHLICRTVGQSNFRKHFPIVVQIPNRAFLDETLQLGKIQGINPVIVQIPGYIQALIKFSNVVELFQQRTALKMFTKLGRNPHTWKRAIQDMARGVTLQTITQGKSEYQQKQKIIAQAKMNRVYTNQLCLSYLNSQTLDFQIKQVLDVFTRIKGMGFSGFNFYAPLIFKKPYFQAMFEQNIFYHMYYLPYIDYSVNLPIYLNYYKKQYTPILNRNNSWIGQKVWRYNNKEYALYKSQLGYTKAKEEIMHERDVFGKDHIDLELETTYYGPIREYKYQYSNQAFKISDV